MYSCIVSTYGLIHVCMHVHVFRYLPTHSLNLKIVLQNCNALICNSCIVRRGGSVASSAPCVQKVAGLNPTLAATKEP